MAKITVWTTAGTIESFLVAGSANMAEFAKTTTILIKNNDTGKIIYLSRLITPTAAIGYPIAAAGSVSLPISALSEYKIISDTASTDVRILPYL